MFLIFNLTTANCVLQKELGLTEAAKPKISNMFY